MDKNDKKLWKAVTRDVKPISKGDIDALNALEKELEARAPAPSAKSKKRKPAQAETAAPKPESPRDGDPLFYERVTIGSTNKTSKSYQSSEVDKRTLQRLKRGQIPIDGRIDLHGLTQDRARDQLFSFIENAYRMGHRCVLVITGKGRVVFEDDDLQHHERLVPGVIKRKTSDWLSDPKISHFILKSCDAQPKDGGQGARYIYLRRHR